MTLFEIIAAYEAHRAATVAPFVLTPKGRAILAARRTGEAIAELESVDDRLDALTTVSSTALRRMGRAPTVA